MSSKAAALTKADDNSLTWWLAAGLVGADIGTSVFYSTGVLYPHVGFAAPFFVLFVALALWFFKTTYQEGCSVNPLNGGAYAMVLQTLGRRSALFVGSLTILSYLATAVVSALAGAHYLSTLWPNPWPVWGVALVAALPVLVFGALNIWGLRESTRLVFGIAAFHFVTLIAMDVWGLYLAFTGGAHWERLWEALPALGPHAVIIGLASAFLGITGFESAAQVIEEIEAPTWKSIRKVYLTIVALVSFTGPVSSLLVVVLLSDAQIEQFRGAFLSGVAIVEGGQPLLYLLVANACLTLFAAVNTAYAGATGLMTTMGKQGNLPAVVLRRWTGRAPMLKGYPFVALPFMGLSLLMLAAFPGSVDRLGEVYGMAFLGVMASYCLGVLLLRLHQPSKVAKSPYKSDWTFNFRGTRLPWAPVLGGVLLLGAEGVLLVSAHDARDLGIQLLLIVVLVMAFYRLGRVESRMVLLPDLRLGLGKYRDVEPMPSLPAHIVCTVGAKADRLVNLISYVIKQNGEDIEIVLFHAEDSDETRGEIAEGLERLVSQQLEDFYQERNVILSVKVLPGSLIEVLPEYRKTHRVDRIYMMTGLLPEQSEILRDHLSTEIGMDVVRLDESALPKGPGVWYAQWAEGFRRNERRPRPPRME